MHVTDRMSLTSHEYVLVTPETLTDLPPVLYQLNPTVWNSLAFGIIAAFLLLLKNPFTAAPEAWNRMSPSRFFGRKTLD